MPSTIDAARRMIQSRLTDLDAEATQLRRALVSLGESASGPRRRGPGRPAKATTTGATSPRPKRRRSGKRKSATRAPRGQRREELLAALKDTPGTRPSELAKAIGVKPAHVHALIGKARAEKLIVKQGKGYALKA